MRKSAATGSMGSGATKHEKKYDLCRDLLRGHILF
jgi:hypothetical protein